MLEFKVHSSFKTNSWIGSHNSDFSDRDSLVADLRETFGDESILYISNFNSLKLKSLLKDLSRLFGVSFDEANSVTKVVEQQVKAATQKHGDDKNLFELKFEDAMEHSPDFKNFMEDYPQVAEVMPQLLGQPKSIGRHAGGILILEDVEKIMPVIKVRGNLQSPWQEGLHIKSLEKLGFLKIDALGLDTLRIIQRCIEKILQRRHGKVFELFVGNRKIEAYENQKILLEDGSWREVKNLKLNDDIKEPIELKI